ncbi:hypothetical protein E2562_021091 [Oryza meyeriana var. granulata]|uniref:Pectinesterase inhibitor domain-containing protein n=1 Tax=Oryza meyeriana var. granulata TaxID=110450 RepID=A0A6G1BL21_9ORYZ|nr:hypothetical protein E2562_021091 [Oryza meyeriana var. granulata]
MASSNGVSALFFFAVLLAASQAQLAASIDSFMDGACKTVAGGSGVVSVTFCIDALGSDSRSRNASSYRDLAVVAIDLLTSNATSTKSKIDSMLQDDGGLKPGDAMTRCLQSCQVAYAGVLQAQPGIFANLQGSRFPEAMSALEKSASAVQECENGFGKSNFAPPLTAEDDDTFQLAKLAALLLHEEP